MKKRLTREEVSWTLYDVANSAYILLATAILPIYIKGVGAGIGYDNYQTTSHWGVVSALGTLAVALLAPVLGAMADYDGKKKRFFVFFLLLGLFSLGAMAFSDNYYVLLTVNLFCALGYAGANNFYDAFLVDVAEDSRMDYLSSLGYAWGYIGSCVPFIVGIWLILAEPFGLTGTAPVKLSILITCLWWALLSLPILRRVRQRYGKTGSPRGLVGASVRQVWSTLRDICKDRAVGTFLLAYFLYIDGVDTIIRMSTSFGSDVGIPDSQMILALLLTQIVAFPAVMVCARLASRFSSKKVLLVSVAIYVGICIFGYYLSSAWQFWLLAVAVALVQGTIQALSRSYFGRIIPKERNNEYFGFYNILGKYATVLGPLLMALFATLTGNTRYGVLSIAVLFIAGFIVLLRVPDLPAAKEKTI